MLGSSELRAQTTAHGAELANLGQRHALRLGRPRLMLAWSERWRAVALSVPPVRPHGDERWQADLAAMRDVSSRLSRASSLGLRTASLNYEQQRLERAVRARALRTLGTGRRNTARSSIAGFDVPGLLAELGDDRLLEIVDIGGELHVLVLRQRQGPTVRGRHGRASHPRCPVRPVHAAGGWPTGPLCHPQEKYAIG